jgi:hypothetical protein
MAGRQFVGIDGGFGGNGDDDQGDAEGLEGFVISDDGGDGIAAAHGFRMVPEIGSPNMFEF